MAEQSIFWATESVGDGEGLYSQSQLFTWLRTVMHGDPASQGVIWDYPPTGPQNLDATIDDSTVLISPGAGVVYGVPYWSDDTATINIPTPVIGSTGHRIVLRADYAAQTVRLTLLSSADGVAGLPALTQTLNTIWDVPLYGISALTSGVITLTDQRVFAVHRTPHIKRQGDTVEGRLALASPLDLINSSGQRWRIQPTAGASPALQLGTVADAGTGDILSLAFAALRSGTDIPTLRLGTNASEVRLGTTSHVFWHDGLVPSVRRQGDADWSGWTASPSNSVLNFRNLLIQFGTAITSGGEVTITFPVAFSAKPWVVAIPAILGVVAVGGTSATTTTTTTKLVTATYDEGALVSVDSPVRWLAIGPA